MIAFKTRFAPLRNPCESIVVACTSNAVLAPTHWRPRRQGIARACGRTNLLLQPPRASCPMGGGAGLNRLRFRPDLRSVPEGLPATFASCASVRTSRLEGVDEGSI